MNTYENEGLLTYKDKDGNLYKMYPVTKKSCLLGMDEVDAHLMDRSNVHHVTADQAGAVPLSRSINGRPMDKDVELIPEDLGIILDTTLSKEGAYAESNAVKNALNEISMTASNQYNDALNVANTALSTANEKISMKSDSVTLPAALWLNNKQTISISLVTSDCTLITSSHPDTYIDYIESGVYCSEKADGSITFSCSYTPNSDLIVNLIILN